VAFVDPPTVYYQLLALGYKADLGTMEAIRRAKFLALLGVFLPSYGYVLRTKANEIGTAWRDLCVAAMVPSVLLSVTAAFGKDMESYPLATGNLAPVFVQAVPGTFAGILVIYVLPVFTAHAFCLHRTKGTN
jgi:hypothetical protein